MNKIIAALILFLFFSCQTDKKNKISCHAWLTGPGKKTDKELNIEFNDLKKKGIDVLLYNGGQDPKVYQRVGKIAKEKGLALHAWIPTMMQPGNPKLKPEWYVVNRLGEPAYEKPAYVEHYKFLCPNHEEVYNFLKEMYENIAVLPEVDGIHLDYIRFPDVILARGLWEKYGLVMDKEYPQFDYCYCDKCVADFYDKTNIRIKEVEDPSQVKDWKQFRYDLITRIVNRLAKMVHAHDKQISAAVFPGPNSIAKKIVRQEWDKWSLDIFYPMNYNDFYLKGTDWIGEVCKESTTSLKNKKPVFSGLFICPNPAKKSKEPDPENHGLLPEELEDAISSSMENGAAGICLFTPNRMTEKHWAVFKKAIYKDFTTKESDNQ